MRYPNHAHPTNGRRSRARRIAVATVLMVGLGAALAGCGAEEKAAEDTVTLITHDSWAMDKKVLAEFTEKTGLRVKVLSQGDAGSMTNKLVLTKDRPLADAVYGIDNTFASRALTEGVFARYQADAPATVADFALTGDEAGFLTPIDYSDVCVNVDDTWFAAKKLAPPRSLDDLVKPAYRGLFVTPGATTSSPGLAFLLTTIAAYGEEWPDYWTKLVANDTAITAGWEDAYTVDFTAGGGNGDRPIVLSYSSSPPFTIPEGETKPTTSALLDTCFRQVEFGGVLKGAANPDGAKKLIDFMTQRSFQEALPTSMYVYPVSKDAELPADWATYAPTATKPWTVDPAEITANRSDWLRQWRDLTSR